MADHDKSIELDDRTSSSPHHVPGHGYPKDPHHAAAIEAQLIQSEQYGQTKRGLKSRHIQLIAIGGAIGTGLFVGSGATLNTVGPAPLFMGFCVLSIIIWCVMMSLAEMTTYLPVPGASVPFYINRFFEPSLAFASGWNYWYAYAILVPAELVAAGIVVEYWTSNVHPAVWITILLALIVILNIFVVSIYGESEFWFASIKIVTIIGLILLSIVLFFGGGPKKDPLYFRYWREPGAFVDFMVPGPTGRFLAFWIATVKSGFAFITSPELVAITAGEAEAPRRNIPKAARRFVYRLIVFYVLGSLSISVIVAYNDENLVKAVSDKKSNAGASPFVLGIQNAGIPVLNHIINAVIITSATSAGNSFLYAASRNLYSLAVIGQAPRVFRKCNKHGVPWVAVMATSLVGCLAYLSLSAGSNTAFTWLTNITTISGFIAWITLLMTYLRFRKALIYNNLYTQRPFKGGIQPYSTWFALIFLVLLTLTNGFPVFMYGNWDYKNFLAAYITLPIFLALYFGHKILQRTPFIRRIEDVDVLTGIEEADAVELLYQERLPRNVFERVWFWIA